MNALSFIYALHSCVASYPQQTVFVDLFDCKFTKGRICYVSSQWESYRADAKDFPKESLKEKLDDWEGERIVDWSNPKIKPIMLKRFQKAKALGCSGVDFDNVDRLKNQSDITWYISEVRKLGMKAGLKNMAEKAKKIDADFNVSEECTQYKECDKYPKGKTFFIAYTPVDKAVCKLRPYTLFADKALKKFKFCP